MHADDKGILNTKKKRRKEIMKDIH